MRTDTASPVRLADYRVPDHLLDTVHLDVSLHPTETRVVARLALRPNPAGRPAEPLRLDGDGLVLVSARLDGDPLPEGTYTATPDALTLTTPPRRPFTLEVETRLDPTANTQLMGLYRSGNAYCTQCEAEGFRRITFFPDRPDVLAVYTVRIEAEREEAPVLLANGNRIETGEAGETRHYAVWHDPFPKPSYLFALVAGRLEALTDSFVTRSGRAVALEIWCEPGKQPRCAYAMDALKRSMAWDEQAFGREYDLDVFMIVAVPDFTMGAMENKGLNVFNDRYILASPDTATDADYAGIETVVAHEYFHNWTGNRITCRDWFQLCLKEGLTVYRDQEFTADQRSRPVKRIADVRTLRTHQFTEDAGPLAHPVRPEAYREINNFYTATVYEKGAELVRMVATLLGPQPFRAGMDLYFARHDGQAATVEQFIACFAEAGRMDLSQFLLWYAQSGTPEVTASGEWDEAGATYRLTLAQHLGPTPGQPTKRPMVVPVRLGLVGAGGDVPARRVDGGDPSLVVLREPEAMILFEGVTERPVLSLLRGFSAPVRLAYPYSEDDLLVLMRRDEDPFNRWQAAQTLLTGLLLRRLADAAAILPEGVVAGMADLLALGEDDPAFAALALTPPGYADLAREVGHDIDPDAIHAARLWLRAGVGDALRGPLLAAHRRLADTGAYSPDATSAGRRALRGVALDLACASGNPEALAESEAAFAAAGTMTERLSALHVLCQHDTPAREAALDAFHRRHGEDPLLLDKWLAAQAAIPGPATLERVRALLAHPALATRNPNRVRALLGTFAGGNPTAFNRADGAGFRLVTGMVREIDPLNSPLAARLLDAFKTWAALEPGRRGHAGEALRALSSAPGLSRDVADIVERALAVAPPSVSRSSH